MKWEWGRILVVGMQLQGQWLREKPAQRTGEPPAHLAVGCQMTFLQHSEDVLLQNVVAAENVS